MMERKNISQQNWKGDFYQRKRDSKQSNEVNSLFENSLYSFGKNSNDTKKTIPTRIRSKFLKKKVMQTKKTNRKSTESSTLDQSESKDCSVGNKRTTRRTSKMKKSIIEPSDDDFRSINAEMNVFNSENHNRNDENMERMIKDHSGLKLAVQKLQFDVDNLNKNTFFSDLVKTRIKEHIQYSHLTNQNDSNSMMYKIDELKKSVDKTNENHKSIIEMFKYEQNREADRKKMDEISNQINTLITKKRDRKLLSKIRKDNNLKSLHRNAIFADIESEHNQVQYVDNTSMPGISEIDKKINKTCKRREKQLLKCTINERFLNRSSSKLE